MRKVIKIVFLFAISILLSLLLYYQATTDRFITKIAGFSMLKISSGSMKPELQIGDIIIIKECENYEVNDIITYHENNQYLVTHRIVKKEGNDFVTKGDNNNTLDSHHVSKNDIEGKVIGNSKFFKWIYHHWIIVIFIILFILIIW